MLLLRPCASLYESLEACEVLVRVSIYPKIRSLLKQLLHAALLEIWV